MQDMTAARHRPFATPGRTTYRHGNAPEAMLGAARRLLAGGDPEAVGLREIARHTGVSAAAAYKHFVDKDDLMATVATEGFRDLSAALEAAAKQPDPAVAIGLAYVEFARSNRGLFRLMFGPLLSERDKYPSLRKAAADVFAVFERSRLPGFEPQTGQLSTARVTMGAIHGLSCLMIASVLPEREAKTLAQGLLGRGP
jgi:AcrR family transcriptional regulator